MGWEQHDETPKQEFRRATRAFLDRLWQDGISPLRAIQVLLDIIQEVVNEMLDGRH